MTCSHTNPTPSGALSPALLPRHINEPAYMFRCPRDYCAGFCPQPAVIEQHVATGVQRLQEAAKRNRPSSCT